MYNPMKVSAKKAIVTFNLFAHVSCLFPENLFFYRKTLSEVEHRYSKRINTKQESKSENSFERI